MTTDHPIDIVDRYPQVIEVDHDECLQCGRPAYVYATLRNGAKVAFCYHDGTTHLPELRAQGAHVVDLRHTCK